MRRLVPGDRRRRSAEVRSTAGAGAAQAHIEAHIADVDMEQLWPYAVHGSGTSSAAGYGRES
jgi:hypothetical protein